MDIFSQIVLVIGRIQNGVINMLGTCFLIEKGKYSGRRIFYEISIKRGTKGI